MVLTPNDGRIFQREWEYPFLDLVLGGLDRNSLHLHHE
jgi:hypothetical protein